MTYAYPTAGARYMQGTNRWLYKVFDPGFIQYKEGQIGMINQHVTSASSGISLVQTC